MELTINQLLKKGINFLNKVNFKKAENCFRIILKSQPQHFEAYYFLGIILNELNKLDEAEANYQNAIKFKPDFAEAYYNLGKVYGDIGKLNDSELNYKKAISFKQDYVEASTNIEIIFKLKKLLSNVEKASEEKIKSPSN